MYYNTILHEMLKTIQLVKANLGIRTHDLHNRKDQAMKVIYK
jgi:hypothetical protein